VAQPGAVIIPASQLILRATALSSGCTDDELARLRRRGVIQSLQREAYVPADASSSSDRSARLHVHVVRLDDDEVCSVDGLSVTTVTRTLFDLGRSLAFESAIVAADFALHEGLATSSALEATAISMSGVAGSLQPTRMVGFADGRSDSVGESRSRVAIAQLGLMAPSRWKS
jgi:hypothetical protein